MERVGTGIGGNRSKQVSYHPSLKWPLSGYILTAEEMSNFLSGRIGSVSFNLFITVVVVVRVKNDLFISQSA